MNIKEAKEQIKNAMTVYFTKDEFGSYRIPIERQRPVFLMGPPGIGKTAIMEQIASEMGVGLVSYSMTHHTRQSALGLPYIVKKEYDGRTYDVSEYTMSEIIGAVYDLMRDSGKKEGILFLDEINCVSETLAPCMLQFLQYKVFGQHRVPDGWIIVTAGNPPEYNRSVRDFDIVTWDRLKRIDVEPDYDAWKEYAYKSGVHPAVMTYLSARRKDFYKVETTVDGKSFVTARGWDDLSAMIELYEENGIPVDEKLISQYLQNAKTAKDFAIYYDLFDKYRNDYKIEAILSGNPPEDVVFRAKMAKFDERLSLTGILFDAITSELRDVTDDEDALKELMEMVKTAVSAEDSAQKLLEIAAERLSETEKDAKASAISPAKQRIVKTACKYADATAAKVIKGEGDIRSLFAELVNGLAEKGETAKTRLNNVFDFAENAFGEGQEILLLVTELTANSSSARFIGRFGCEKYFEHNKELMFSERQKDILAKIDELSLEQ